MDLAHFLDPADTYLWIIIALVLFFALLAYLKVPEAIGKSLDQRADGIRKELDDARRMREEAQQLLADYQRRSREAEDEAKQIIAQAKREAEALAAETRKALSETVERRTKAAEEKIARAEAQALGEVKSAAVDAALTAAERILRAKVTGAEVAGLIDQSIRDIKGRLN
ncbi:MAG: F0F1 ATP synthase subunit B [Hyphomicrobium sp.]|nr:F0F1 ATP synthase subunit B [Hyphomicrobium sp.]